MKSCFNLANAALIRYLNFLLVFQRKMKQECLGGTEAPISMIFGYFYNMASMDGLGEKRANKIANYNDVYKTCITDLSGIPPEFNNSQLSPFKGLCNVFELFNDY